MNKCELNLSTVINFKKMKHLTGIIALSIVLMVTAGCSNKFYEAKEFKTIKRKHQIIAVLPASIDMDAGVRRSATSEAKTASVDKAYSYQKALTARLQNNAGNYSVSLLDAETVNKKLEEEYVSYFNITKTPVEKIGNILRVDGILYSEIQTPVMLGKNPGSNNKEKIKVKVYLKEANNNMLLWSYQDEYKAGKVYNIEAITQEVFDKIGGKFPYKE